MSAYIGKKEVWALCRLARENRSKAVLAGNVEESILMLGKLSVLAEVFPKEVQLTDQELCDELHFLRGKNV